MNEPNIIGPGQNLILPGPGVWVHWYGATGNTLFITVLLRTIATIPRGSYAGTHNPGGACLPGRVACSRVSPG